MIEIRKLSNGLTVVCEPLDQLRSVSLGLWLHVGAMMEEPGEMGLSHFLEHMMFKGTGRRTTRQIAEETDAAGGRLNAFTSKDCTCVHTRVIDEELADALDIISDLALHSVIPPDELERERGVILEEIAMDEDTPDDLVVELLHRTQFAGQRAGQPILGPAEQVTAYRREDLLRFREAHYTPERAVLSVCGHFDMAELMAEAERCLGGWHSGAAVAPLPPMSPLTGQTVTREKDIEQLHLCLGHPGLPYGDPRATALHVLSTALGGGMSSRLFQRIREEMGAAYTVASFSNAAEGAGSFQVYAGVSPQNGRRVLEEIRAIENAVLRGGLTEKEFLDAKKQIRTGFILGLESSGARMQANGLRMLILGDVREPEEWLRELEEVSLEDLREVAGHVLSAPPCLAAVGKDADMYREAPV